MRRLPVDHQSNIVKDVYAVVYTPRRHRDRFPQNCVEVFDSMEEALAAADPAQKRYAAKVSGPSRSSEGQQLYYLLQWLSGEST